MSPLISIHPTPDVASRCERDVLRAAVQLGNPHLPLAVLDVEYSGLKDQTVPGTEREGGIRGEVRLGEGGKRWEVI